ncbi:MAG: lysylphosphatidylglycerol synthase transmembrane domain-containing protein [Gemmataceae bacterium]
MKNLLRILGSVALIGLLAFRLDWGQLSEAFLSLDYRMWLLALFVYIGAQFISSLRWQMLSEPLGFSLPFLHYVKLYFIGMFFNLLLPTSVGGDVARAWYLGAPLKRRGAALLSVLAERGSGLAMLMLMALIAAFFVPFSLPPWIIGLLVGVGSVLMGGLLCLPMVRRMTRLPGVGNKILAVENLLRTYASRPGLIARAMFLSVLVQLASVTQMACIAQGLKLDIPFLFLAIVVPLVSLLTLLPVSLNGMGLREVGMVLLLAPIGITPAQAVTLSLLQFTTLLVASLIGALLYPAVAGGGPRMKKSTVPDSDPPPRPSGESHYDPAIRRNPDQGREGQSSAAA